MALLRAAALIAARLPFCGASAGAGDSYDQIRRAKAHDETAKYISRDFSGLLWPHTPFLGFIGPDYQRLKIIFTKIVRDQSDPRIYHVDGFSAVRGNRCDFAGTVRVTKILTWGKDDSAYEEFASAKARAYGTFRADYALRETSAQPASGAFNGSMALDWYVDRDGALRYDDVMTFEDGYSNNQYEGTWTSYKSGKAKTANWGEFRIPSSGDLDTGVGEFWPNEKYRKNGWDDPEWTLHPSKD